jgi:hypothetical protein
LKRSLVILTALVCAMLIGPGNARTASDLTCSGLARFATYNNVVVPPNANCTLDAVRVLGNVTVKTNGSLMIRTMNGDITVGGNVTGNGCNFMELEIDSFNTGFRIAIGGDFVATNCTGASFSGSQGSSGPGTPPMNALIGGNVKCNNNSGGCVFDYTVVGKNVECTGNFDCDMQSDAAGGDVTIKNSTSSMFVLNSIIGGDLACSGNSGPTGSGDTVAGKQTGDCSTF